MLGVQVSFGATGGDGSGSTVELVPLGTTIGRNACSGISEVVGAAVLRLTSGQ
jgi:hypothetical protein